MTYNKKHHLLNCLKSKNKSMPLARGIVALSLIPLSAALHVLFSTRFERYEHRPLWAVILILASLIVLFRLLIKTKPTKTTLVILNLAGWAMAAGILWWAEIMSQYPAMETQYKIGDELVLSTPQEFLKDSSGNPFSFELSIKKKPFTLFIFYRGHW